MDWKLLVTVFTTVFIAELGDKTQLATLLYAMDPRAPKLVVFFGAALALIMTSALGVIVGGWISETLNERIVRTIAGFGFIAIGAWTLFKT